MDKDDNVCLYWASHQGFRCHTFDIREDHLDALKKIQMAERDLSGKRSGKTLGDMAQEALDDWVSKQAKHLDNIEIRHSRE